MKKRSIFYILFYIFFFLSGLPGFAGGPGPEPREQREVLSESQCKQILQEMSKKLSLNRSLRARFEQERHLVMFGDVLRSEGFLYYRNPGRIRWEFTRPYGSITIMLENGEVGKFDVIDGRAVKVETAARKVLGEVLTQIVNWQKGNLAGAGEDFEMRMYRGAKYRLVLKPVSKGLAKILPQLEFEIDRESFLVDSVTLREDENDYTVIRFYDQALNEELPAGLFDLKGPGFVKNSGQ